MRKKLTYILAITLILCVLNPLTSFAEKDEVIKIDLDQAIRYALENSKDLKIKEIELEKEKTIYRDKIREVKASEDNVDNFPTRGIPTEDNPAGEPIPDATVSIGMIKYGGMRKSVELPRDIAKWNLELKENEIKYNVEKAYYDLLQMERELEIAGENLSLSEKQYKQGQLKYELGIISQLELLGLEMGLFQAQNILASTDMYYQLQIIAFQNTLGMPLGEKIQLTDGIESGEYDHIDLEKSIDMAFKNNVTLKMAEESYELSGLILRAIKAQYPENTYRYREQEAELAKAEKNLETVKNGVEIGIRSAYLNLINSEKQMTTMKKAVKQAEKALKIADLSFDLGQATPNDVVQANINLMNAKKGLSSQIHAFNLALLDYEYSLGAGKGFFGG